jgi:spore coat protein U-like protein
VLALLALVLAQSAWGAAVCRFSSSIPDMGFGSYDLLTTTPTDTQLDVLVQCDRKGGPQNVTLDLGINQGSYGTSVANRRLGLAGGTDVLNYGLFRDAGRSANWGFTSGVDTGTLTLSVPNNGSATGVFRIFGRIPARQNVSPGSYSDRIQLTLNP